MCAYPTLKFSEQFTVILNILIFLFGFIYVYQCLLIRKTSPVQSLNNTPCSNTDLN